MKKGLALLLAASMAVSAFSSAAMAADLTAQEKFDALVEAGIFTGFEDGSAGLEEEMTRAQVATIVFRLLGLEEDEAGAAAYKDLVGAEWAAGYIGAITPEYMEGYGDGKFGPSDTFTYEQLATVLVRVLDLEVDAEATVEGNVSDWAQANVAAAVAAGVITAQDDYTAPALREALVLAAFAANEQLNPEVTEFGFKAIGAKKLQLTLGKAFTDETITVKRGSVTINGTWTWNDAKTVGTLETAVNLVAGDYTVTVTPKSGEAQTATIKVEASKVVKLEINGDVLPRTVTGETYKNEATVSYVATNQYGEDVTKNTEAASINWSASVATTSLADDNKGKLTIATANDVLKDDAVVVLTGVITQDGGSVIGSKTLKAAKTSTVSKITLTELISPKDKELSVSSTDKFYIALEAVDQYGNVVTDESIVARDLTLLTSDSTNFTVAVAKKDDKPALEITKHTAKGTFIVTAVVKASAANSQFSVTVKEDVKVDTFTLEQPTERLTGGKEFYLPYSSFDQFGAELKKYDALDTTAEVNITTSDSTKVTAITKEKDPISGELKVKIKLADNAKGNVVMFATANNKVSQVALTIEEQAVPANIQGIKDATILFEKGVSSAAFNKGNIVIKDQYGDDVALGAYNSGADVYTVKVTSADSDVTVTGTEVTSAAGVTLNGSNTAGDSEITLQLLKNGVAVEGVTYKFTAKTIEKKDIADFFVKEVGTVHGPNAAANLNYKVGLELKGLTSDNQKVALTDASITNITATGTGLNIENASSVTAAVYGVGNNDTDSSDEFTSGIVAIFEGANGPVTKTQSVKVVEKAPEAVTIAVKGSAAKDGYALVGHAALAAGVNTQSTSAVLYLSVTDQYGVANQVQPTQYYVTNNDTGLTVTATGGTITVAGANATHVGKSFVVTAVAANGVATSVKVVVGN